MEFDDVFVKMPYFVDEIHPPTAGRAPRWRYILGGGKYVLFRSFGLPVGEISVFAKWR